MGSVKDLEIIKKPTENESGTGRFHFSNRYSVFDWGEMPDHINGKGESLCLMGAYCFERLEEKGVKTHYRGLVEKDGKTVTFTELKHPTNTMEVDLVNVYRPKTHIVQGKVKYDYSFYTPILTNCLIPLEIIYRNGLPEGSSVFKRLEEGRITPKDLGLTHFPKPGERFAKPIFDVSTKLEETDRYINWEEAIEIAGLTNQELISIKSVLSRVNSTITDVASNAGLKNEDGKIELAFDNERQLMIVDVVGTLDECRFMHDTLHVSKEIARKFYKTTEWYQDVEKAKHNAEKRCVKRWKEICKSQPPKLPVQLKSIISGMYMATANEMTNRKLFAAPPLVEIIETYKEYLVRKK